MPDQAQRNLTDTPQPPPRKPRPRTAFARVKGIEHGGKLWTVTLTKSGVRVHRRWMKASQTLVVPLGQLINLALRQPELTPAPHPEAPHHD